MVGSQTSDLDIRLLGSMEVLILENCILSSQTNLHKTHQKVLGARSIIQHRFNSPEHSLGSV